MARFKNARKVNYIVQRDRNTGHYFVVNTATNQSHMVKKTTNGWYAGTLYHPTLRDAIIYCAYGV